MHKDISKVVLQRLPVYLNYLKTIPEKDGYISATVLASRLNLGEVQVRKDLASVSCAGKPKVGYEVKTLISELEKWRFSITKVSKNTVSISWRGLTATKRCGARPKAGSPFSLWKSSLL